MQQLNQRLFSWASILEEKTRLQAEALSRMPFIFPHVALMPDAHLGKGATVGSVIPTEGAIIPAAVGVDIGCGMIALRTQWTRSDFDIDLPALREEIERLIPTSAGRYNDGLDSYARLAVNELELLAVDLRVDPDDYSRKTSWTRQLGSLGSGNHFIEISEDETSKVWLFLHSGSRGVGNQMAQHFISVAQANARNRFIKLEDRDLAYLVEGEEDFDAYIRHLRWAQEFARLNRVVMMRRLQDAVSGAMSEPVLPTQEINCHHNYTTRERHFGRQVWLSRKGAIDASAGTWGLIPGSMGAASYVVQGLGNRLSLNSSPHGAGRNYSRSAAKRTFTMADLEERMAGIEWRHTDAFLDEHPLAYKDIDVVMADAADLVEVRHTLRQFVNVKGD
jgi:tRNA-splicing ligase RtcB